MILELVLKHKWYDMIDQGKKEEEYRECSPYWINRLRDKSKTCVDKQTIRCSCDLTCWQHDKCNYANFKFVRFRRGYTNTTMLYELKNISIGIGRQEWGAPNYEVFIIKLGNKIVWKR